jgi:hypothetical protein
MAARSRIAWPNDTAEVPATEIVDSRENRYAGIPKRDRRSVYLRYAEGAPGHANAWPHLMESNR